MYKVSERKVGDVTILDIDGRIEDGEGCSLFGDEIRRLIGEQKIKVLLNLEGVTYINSRGIGELVSAFTKVTNSGGRIKLLQLTKRVEGLLMITKLYTIFDVFGSEADAIRSFN